ncbi:MAG TPA: arginine--tRNA ligase [Candidatus Acidoferrum sp.]|nr:arginine--tRNA ligase [Candidatus Acidoferrum sp.]
MYLTIIQRLREALAANIREKYGCEINVVLERPPRLELGEAASPVCFELAKRLRKAPRQIAQEIVSSLPPIAGVARVEVAGGGYLNAFIDRGAFWESLWAETTSERRGVDAALGRVIVEHSSINPNKAAHIGHLRNAVLGDTMVRMLRHTGHDVAVQNYIDNTGVQVADVVIAFREMEKKSLAEVRKLASEPRFDYLCWDLYAKATQFFEEEKTRAAKLRGETLKAIEEGTGEIAEMATVIADAIVSLHLRSMARLDIFYELLARESEILHLHFWDAAFEKLKARGAIQLATSGKNAGCWIMPWGKEGKEVKEIKEVEESAIGTDSSTSFTSSASITSPSGDEEQAKIIVRSNGTVTYVGKDIAYQLWKFGLLGKDFHYRLWPKQLPGHVVWATTTEPNDPRAPHFGNATAVYNVIDTRQAYLQEVVAEGLRALGHAYEADHSIHFDYQIVALTPRCAAELGYEITADEAKKAYVEVSGRKGHGVKADDLITKLEAAALAEVQPRHAEMPSAEQLATAHAIAVSALRFFLLKYTRNTIIAFDFKDALSFEGETGPYCQYAVVRIRGIRRKGVEAGTARAELSRDSVEKFLGGVEGNGLWELVLESSALDYAVDAGIGAQEPAFVAKYAFQLAQGFNVFYHKHHILSETDEQKRAFLLGLTELVERQLVRALQVLGIEAPEKM